MLVSYNDALSDALLKDLLSNDKVKLRIGQKDYFISKISFERFNASFFIEGSKPVKIFSVNFVKPAYFSTSMGSYPVRFPIPVLLFGNLANLWNDIFKGTAEVDREKFIAWVNAHVYISGYDMKSATSEIGKEKPVVGGLGSATYRVTKIDKNYYLHMLKELNREYDYQFVNENYANNCRWLEILCKLGELTNIGGNRTAGMGVMRYYPKSYVSPEDLLKNPQNAEH